MGPQRITTMSIGLVGLTCIREAHRLTPPTPRRSAWAFENRDIRHAEARTRGLLGLLRVHLHHQRQALKE